MSLSEQYKYDEVCIDPALLSPSRDSVHISPVVENIPNDQLLWEAPSDTSLYLPDYPWPSHVSPTCTDTTTASLISVKGHRGQLNHISGRKKKAEAGVVDLPAPMRPKNDKTCKLSTRERNRIAACRCRLKKGKEIKHLEEEERLISIKRKWLSAYLASLQSEVSDLEKMLVAHCDCDCVVIRKYFENRQGLP